MTDTAPRAAVPAQRPYPARSKMLDVYAGDIARMLVDGRQESPERAALAIPHIAVALADSSLHSSRSAYLDWCRKWVQPGFDTTVYEDWCSRSSDSEHDGNGVPFAALRSLRLRRWAREVAVPSRAAETETETEAAPKPSTPRGVTRALLGAAFRWYEQEGRYASGVQTNLARLGVLR
jgi:hypothetical protein